jgi:hypothetical protein
MPLPLIAVAGYGTAALVAGAIAALHAGRVVVPRVAEWEDEPVVWLHPDLERLIGPLIEAIIRWDDLGHKMHPGSGTVHPDPGDAPGVIRILPRPIDRVRGRALAVVSADFEAEEPPDADEDDHEVDAPEGLIRRAVIYVDPVELATLDAARVLAHELGHCLGFLHCTARLRRADASRGVQVPKSGHLMHPRYQDGGWTTTGLEADALGDPRERRMARRRDRERRSQR